MTMEWKVDGFFFVFFFFFSSNMLRKRSAVLLETVKADSDVYFILCIFIYGSDGLHNTMNENVISVYIGQLLLIHTPYTIIYLRMEILKGKRKLRGRNALLVFKII